MFAVHPTPPPERVLTGNVEKKSKVQIPPSRDPTHLVRVHMTRIYTTRKSIYDPQFFHRVQIYVQICAGCQNLELMVCVRELRLFCSKNVARAKTLVVCAISLRKDRRVHVWSFWMIKWLRRPEQGNNYCLVRQNEILHTASRLQMCANNQRTHKMCQNTQMQHRTGLLNLNPLSNLRKYPLYKQIAVSANCMIQRTRISIQLSCAWTAVFSSSFVSDIKVRDISKQTQYSRPAYQIWLGNQ